MISTSRTLTTRRGTIELPAYVPITTFGDKYPLDRLVQPYLPRLASATMVSFHYARQMTDEPRLPLMVDSGGFAALFAGARIVSANGIGTLEIEREGEMEVIHPRDVLDLQEKIADIGFTLDFPIPPGTEPNEACRRLDLTISNARWALANRRRRDLLLFACIQAWDVESARTCAQAYADLPFDGVAIGGLVPRARNRELVLDMVRTVRAVIGETPIHVLGLGNPDLVRAVFEAGADSVDSSSYLKLAASGRLWSHPDLKIDDPTPTDLLHLALCNLATAAGRSLPLSTSNLAFTTARISGLRRQQSRDSQPIAGHHQVG